MKIITRQTGFTLVEVLVSIVIISIIVTAFSTAFLNSNKSIKVSKNKSEAFTLGQRELLKVLGNSSYSSTTEQTVKISVENSNQTIDFSNGNSIEISLEKIELNTKYLGFNDQYQDLKINSYRILK